MKEHPNIGELDDEDIEKHITKSYGKGYQVKILEIIRHKAAGATVVLYRVKCDRDGAIEYRCKGWGKAMGGWDYVTRRKF